jgi:hypothetical protein
MKPATIDAAQLHSPSFGVFSAIDTGTIEFYGVAAYLKA